MNRLRSTFFKWFRALAQGADMSTQMNLESGSGIRRVLQTLSASSAGAKYFGILLILLAFGYGGHQSHWTFGYANHSSGPGHSEPGHSEPAHEAKEVKADASPAVPKEETASNGWEIEFPSENSLRCSGVKTSPIEQRAIREQVKTTGVVTYDERMSAMLSSRASGTVWKVVKQAGDPVVRGDVLVIIDAAEVGRAKAEFLSELVAVESKSEILATRETIPDVIPRRQIREAQVAVREAKIRLQNAEQTLVNMGFRLRKETFEKLSDIERATKLQFLGLPDFIVKDLDHDQASSSLLALSASFDGVLIRNDVATGEMAEAGKPVVEIADLRRMWLKLDVSKEDASKLALGQRVRFTPDGVEKELESTISWISTGMNEQTRTLQIRAEVDNPIVSTNLETGHQVRMLRAQTFGTGSISLGETASAFVVPVSAVLHAEEQPIVFVQTGDLSFRRLDVKLGLREGKFVQIESDYLKPGMAVVSHGNHVLKSEWVLNHVAQATP